MRGGHRSQGVNILPKGDHRGHGVNILLKGTHSVNILLKGDPQGPGEFPWGKALSTGAATLAQYHRTPVAV